jgi:LDH2 family malate/lactate/ureidoglycolate dehydrogenase
MPQGRAADRDGKPTTDPKAGLAGFLRRSAATRATASP